MGISNNKEKKTMNENERFEMEFKQLIETYSNVIFKVCRFYFSDIEDIKDLYQEIIIRIWKGYPQFQGHSKISTWIYQVALNSASMKI